MIFHQIHSNFYPLSTGEFLKYVPHHQGPGKEKTSDLDEFKQLWAYKCPFEGCDKNTGRAKTIGYKEFAIHSGEFGSIEDCLLN